MTQQQHPINPPPELVQQWLQEADVNQLLYPQVAAKAAQWGADQELEACCEWLEYLGWHGAVQDIRAAHIYRRPKPPSLKEQALEELDAAILRGDCFSTSPAKDTIRRALKSTPDPS